MTPVERSDEAAPARAADSPAPVAAPASVAAPAVAGPPPPTRAGGQVAEWFLRKRALAHVHARAPLSRAQLEMLRRARLSFELAERALDPVEPFASGDGAPAALAPSRESVYWLLRAHATESEATPASLAEAFDLAPAAIVRDAAGGDDAVAALREALVPEPFAEAAERSVDQQRTTARAALEFARALDARLEGHNKIAAERLLWQRALRIAAGVALVIFVAFAAGLGIRSLMRPPDIARGATWRTSSAYVGYATSGQLGSHGSDIFFHTKEDKDPWFEVDLGASRKVASVLVENRSDYGQDRAVPLVVELSDDGEAWAEVARQPNTFRSWTATFPARNARFVRLRVSRLSFLHLRRVSVFDR